MDVKSLYIRLAFVGAILFPSSACGEVSDPFFHAASSYLLKINGAETWARNPDVKLPPASLTKIMTALIVVEKSGIDDIVTVNRAASRETGTRIRLKEGERFYVIDLLAAALLQSANDACRALAEHLGGSEDGFVSMMNKRAAELGMDRSHFTNACGHDQSGHYSTARDLARLTEVALKNPVIGKMVSLIRGEIATVEGKRRFSIENQNELIGRYPGAIGMKSGFTPKAGKCVIALAEKGGKRVMLVLLNAPNRWWDAEDILERAFRLGDIAYSPKNE